MRHVPKSWVLNNTEQLGLVQVLMIVDDYQLLLMITGDFTLLLLMINTSVQN